MTNRESSSACGGCRASPLPPPAGASAIERRTFLVQCAMLAAATALAACGADTTAPTLSGGASVNVNDYPALANVGGIALVTVSGARLAIVRTGAGAFVALSRVCPHQGATVDQSGTGFRCPQHGATFSSTGTWTGGQRTSNLHSYITSYDPATGILALS